MNMSTINTWDDRFLKLAAHVSTWSKDPVIQVGAVLVDKTNPREYYTGYNGFPRRVYDHPNRYLDKNLKHQLIIHAELNAIFNAQRDLTGFTLYTTRFPCIRCVVAVMQSGITNIVTYLPTAEDIWKHKSEYALSIEVVKEAQVGVKLWLGGKEVSLTQLSVLVEQSDERTKR